MAEHKHLTPEQIGPVPDRATLKQMIQEKAKVAVKLKIQPRGDDFLVSPEDESIDLTTEEHKGLQSMVFKGTRYNRVATEGRVLVFRKG